MAARCSRIIRNRVRMASKDSMDMELWLSELLNTVGVDGEVYGGYISGTLATMEGSSQSEMEEALVDILTGCVEEDDISCASLANQIAARWRQELRAKEEEKQSVSMQVDSLTKVRSQTKEQSTLTPAQPTHITSSGNRQGLLGVSLSAQEKKKLIAEYGCESDGDDEASPDPGGGGGGGRRDAEELFLNTNAFSVVAAEQLKREQHKAAHEAKVQRDRKSREIQKQRAQERKEKEKRRTQKQERRR